MAGIDFKAIFQDNAKLFLSILGILALSLYIGINGGAGLSLNLPGINTGGNLPAVNDNDGNTTTVRAINNGKSNFYTNAPAYQLQSNVDYQAEISTSLGLFTVDLYEQLTPNTVNNFVFLSQNGFYSGTSFHKIIQNFIIQGGDPQGDGFGGPGYVFADEIRPDVRFKPYSIAMANGGANTNGSQFFIVSKSANTSTLNSMYTVFGEVVSGQNVVDAIESVSVKPSTPNQYMPFTPVMINSIRVVQK